MFIFSGSLRRVPEISFHMRLLELKKVMSGISNMVGQVTFDFNLSCVAKSKHLGRDQAPLGEIYRVVSRPLTTRKLRKCARLRSRRAREKLSPNLRSSP